MENDLISRSALLADIEEAVVVSARNTTSAEIRGVNKVVDRIKAAPAVDAVEVVRCTECQYMKIKAGLCYCKVWQGYNGMGSEGFCSYGERKTE